MLPASADVVVVGGGNAALCAAISAAEHGVSVLVLERAPEDEAGGNSRFTAGAMRCVYDGVEDLTVLMPDLTEQEVAQTDFGTYTEDQFFDDMYRVTEYRTDPELTEVLVKSSRDTLRWMKGKGVRFAPIWGRQAFKVDGRFKFWGGLTIESHGGGPGLVASLTAIARKNGINVLYDARAVGLVVDDHGVQGIRVRHGGKTGSVKTRNVVLAAGGFQANAEMRTRYMGPGWELAKVRGTRFNTGDGIKMALDANAMPTGNWSGGHAVAWDRNAPEFGDLSVGDNFQKHNYPFSIMINANGERFVDEGADFRNYTYAKYGRVILMQPGQFCWQVFDNAKKALETINAFNAAVKREVPFNPNVKDGRCAVGLPVPKSNWAITIEEPPFEAYAVTCGLTFTFGGVKIDTSARVIDTDGQAIPGLYAAGEMVGGIFYFNYPGGTGLTNGSVFGRIAGTTAGSRARGSNA
jgi:tricarballylate dehydrogenase